MLTNTTHGHRFNTLLKPPAAPTSNPGHLSADDFANHFMSNIDGIRAATASAPAPDIEARTVPILSNFPPTTIREISGGIINKSPPKRCDPLPTWLLKQAMSMFYHLCSVISAVRRCRLMFYTDFSETRHRASYSEKPTFDVNDLSSYQPISNLSFMSKTVELVVAASIPHHVDSHQLLPDRQCAYCRFHSTETAIHHRHHWQSIVGTFTCRLILNSK